MRKFLKSQKNELAALTAVVGMTAISSAHATLPTWATTLGTDLTTAIDDVVAAVGPVVVAGLIAFITIKLIKRGANKI